MTLMAQVFYNGQLVRQVTFIVQALYWKIICIVGQLEMDPEFGKGGQIYTC